MIGGLPGIISGKLLPAESPESEINTFFKKRHGRNAGMKNV